MPIKAARHLTIHTWVIDGGSAGVEWLWRGLVAFAELLRGQTFFHSLDRIMYSLVLVLGILSPVVDCFNMGFMLMAHHGILKQVKMALRG